MLISVKMTTPTTMWGKRWGRLAGQPVEKANLKDVDVNPYIFSAEMTSLIRRRPLR